MPQEKQPGYIRTDVGLRVLDYAFLLDENFPDVRMLAIKTDDGVVSLVLNRQAGEALLRDLGKIVPEIPKPIDS